MFRVSVVIPVYNAAEFVRFAVESAIDLEEVGEVILIEDNSPDNALEICLQLQNEYEKVKLYRHPNGENRGAGASRNLGIKHAQCEYIAFLDADDWYLQNRFIETKVIFGSDHSIDGVYESTGFYDDSTKRELPEQQTTLTLEVNPKDLLYTLLLPNTGRFTTNAITVKKQLLLDVGLFDTTLRLHQDTHLWLRLAHSGKLVAGNIISPVAMRRVHEQNRIAYHKQTYKWFVSKPEVDRRAFKIIFRRNLTCYNNAASKALFLAKTLSNSPKLLLKII
jgi:glycosyltransferase involved in cell wall biosynthesis